MSKYIDDIIADIKANPTTWNTRDWWVGIQKNKTDIWGYWNTAILSIIEVLEGNLPLPMTWMDKYKLEKAVGHWYKTIPFNHLKK